MNKIIVSIYILAALALLAGAASAQTNVSIGSGSAAPGGTVTVPLMINNVTNVGVADINLVYNASVVQVTAVANSQFDFVDSTINNATGVTRIGAMQLASSGLSGNVKVADVTLKVVGVPGSSSPIGIVVTELRDASPQQNPIPASVVNGTLTILTVAQPVQTVSPASTTAAAPTPVSPDRKVSQRLQESLDKASPTSQIPVIILVKGDDNLTRLYEDLIVRKDAANVKILSIASTVAVKASPQLILELSQKPFVEVIDLDATVQIQEPGQATVTPISVTPAAQTGPAKKDVPGFGVVLAMLSFLIYMVTRGFRRL